MSSAALALSLWLLAATPAAVSESDAVEVVEPAGDTTPTLATMVVTGTLPGPGLWQVRKDDHTLWLLGTVNPLPKDMQWDSSDVDALVAEADEVLTPGGVSASLGAGGMFKVMLLAPKAYAAVKNADGKRLNDVLPPETYARWAELKGKYLAKDRKVERQRPAFASTALYSGAIRESNMSREPVVWNHIAAIAERHDVPITSTQYQFKLDIDRKKTKAGLKTFNATAPADVTCMSETLDTLESDLETMKQTANAWATGDVPQLRQLDLEELQPPCQVVLNDAMGLMVDMQHLEQEAVDLWLAKAESALTRNRSTVAVVGMQRLLSADGLLAQLRARGYQVIDPDLEVEDAELEADSVTAVDAQQ